MLVHKVLIAILVLVTLESAVFRAAVVPGPRNERSEKGWRDRLANLDGVYYLRLAEHGYSANDEACAFYPLWPLLIRAASPLLGGDLLIAGLLLALVFSSAGMLLFYKLVASQAGEDSALKSLILLAAFPGAVFFNLVYTEALFFFLSMVFFSALPASGSGWCV